ncbi:MAG: hypothetical protein NUV91_02285, partial [Candidatus Omnitrophica bacterium]|nr:hypothetical protein [Candidatus Omnitrophota bacterium]
MPQAGTIIQSTQKFTPAYIKGITFYSEHPFRFNFIINPGDSALEGEAFKTEANKLIRYFLASLTVPEKEQWVNLSPQEPDRIIPEGFGTTDMGRDLLAQDYLLKQLTASLMHPEQDLGKTFWERVYNEAYQRYGTTQVPVNAFNKVWIVPQKAVVYEYNNTAFVVESRLRVLLEEEYLEGMGGEKGIKQVNGGAEITKEMIHQIILPAIEQEVNEGKNFAPLRQVYNAVILATWYKRTFQEGILGHLYMD